MQWTTERYTRLQPRPPSRDCEGVPMGLRLLEAIRGWKDGGTGFSLCSDLRPIQADEDGHQIGAFSPVLRRVFNGAVT